ncbi:MAG: four helix bundle protein [Deltaproteobacteria bacterium]|nr:four helix bundle protein [Deltaproteobacteria bacterium]
MKTYRDLMVWQKSMLLVTAVYRETKSFPPDERYGLTSPLRRSAVSVPANMAEGYGRNSTLDFVPLCLCPFDPCF